MDKQRILVVDPDAGRRDGYRAALAVLDAELVEAATAAEAFTATRAGTFAAAVVDVQQQGRPGLDGYELLAMLRRDERLAGLPVVFTSAGADPGVRVAGFQAGAAGVVLNAPREPELLRHQMRALLDLRREQLRLQQRLAEAERHLRLAQEDVERQKRETESVRRQATNDMLTGLPNRLLFEDRINGALVRAKRARSHLALAYVDLDDFRKVNEAHGRAAGDELLATVARRLAGVVRASDTVARLAGDEFAVVLEGLDSAVGAEHVGRKILKVIAEPVQVRLPDARVIELRMGASVGMAMFPDHAEQRNDLLMLADLAMYAVKREGGGLRIAKGAVVPARASVVAPEVLRRRPASHPDKH